jgi:hypothetical protein
MSDQGYEGIVVLGSPRSGTTLVRRLLNAHPRICCPPETNLLRGFSNMLREEQSSEGLTIGVVPGLAFSGYTEAQILDRFRDLFFSFEREMAAQAGKPRWAEKTAFDAFHIDQIDRLIGDHCRYLCVTRHGMDVACSIKELSDAMDRYLAELHRYVQRWTSPLEAFAHAWVDCNRAILELRARRPLQCVSLRYESLLENPATELKRVFEALDEPADVEAVLGAAFSQGAEVGLGDWKTYMTAGLNKASVARWKSLPADVAARLSEIVNPMLVELDYPAVIIDKLSTGESARQRYRAMKMVNQMRAQSESTGE